MSRWLWALRFLISHWWRNPVQCAAMLAGLAVATALWSGVQAINAEARDSYARAARLLGADRLDALVASGGGLTDRAAFVALRRAGVPVSPVTEGRLRGDWGSVRVLGIEPVSLPRDAAPGRLGAGDRDLTGFLTPPGLGLAGPETAARLSGALDGVPVESAEGLPEGVLIVDIGVAQRLLDLPGQVSRLLLAPEAAVPATLLTAHGLARQRAEGAGDLARLTDSFHLNLTAFGFLAFAVGLFIARSAAGLAAEQRLGLFRTLRATGLSARALAGVLLAETLGFALLAGAAGVLLGWVVAGALMPGVALSLDALYGAEVSSGLRLRPEWLLAGLGMSCAGAVVASAETVVRAARMPPLSAARPQAWRAAQARAVRWQTGAGLALWAGGAALLWFGSGLVAGFGAMAGLLLGAALLLPGVLVLALRLGARTARGPRAEWAWADMRQQSSALSLALMALLLALSANIGVAAMVESFRGTFLEWLDGRLAAEVYMRGADEAEARALDAFAAGHPEVTAVLPVRVAEIALSGWPVWLHGLVDDPTYRDRWPMLRAQPRAWEKVFSGEAALISEQLSRRFGLGPGDRLAALGGLEIAGVYPDYGNPTGQAVVAQHRLLAAFPGAERRGTGVRMAPGAVAGFLDDLTAAFPLRPDQVRDQAGLKAVSRGIFEQTFAVTAALNVLTLGVAGLALFIALMSLAERRLPQLAPVWAMGVPRAALARGELTRAVALAVLTGLMAIPLGVAVAWLLVAVVNVEAFGWRLPLRLYPLQWLTLVAVAAGVAALAAAWPAWRLGRIPPAHLVKVFADAR